MQPSGTTKNVPVSNEQNIGDKDNLRSEPCWTNERKDENELGTFLIMVYLQSTYKRTQSRLIAGYTGKIYNDQTLKQFYLKTAPHTEMCTQTKINPGVLQRTPAAREGGELRPRSHLPRRPWGLQNLRPLAIIRRPQYFHSHTM